MSSGTVEVVTVGEGLVCLAPAGTQRLSESAALEKSFGGAELNTAIGLSRLGATTEWVSRVGADGFGDEMLGILAREGVGTSHVRAVHGRVTGLMVKERADAEHVSVGYYRAESATATMEPGDMPSHLVAEARVVHLTGIGLALGAGPAATMWTALELCRASQATCTFDPNFRELLWTPEEARPEYRRVLPFVDHCLCNEREATLITGHRDMRRAAHALAEQGPTTVIIKRGGRGALALVDGEEYEVPAAYAPHPVDTVGAGDAFNAGWIFGTLRSLPPAQSLQVAAWVAARVVEHASDYEGFPHHDRLRAAFEVDDITIAVQP